MHPSKKRRRGEVESRKQKGRRDNRGRGGEERGEEEGDSMPREIYALIFGRPLVDIMCIILPLIFVSLEVGEGGGGRERTRGWKMRRRRHP